MRILVMVAGMVGGLFVATSAQDGDALSEEERSRFVFFAVLETCIEDNLPKEALDRILTRGKDNERVNFIPKCPICHPVLDAFVVYASADTTWTYTVKDRIAEDLLAQIKSKSPEECQAGLKRYVERAIQKRYRTLRMTDTERNRMETAIRAGMKEGLKRIELRPEMKDCPSCRGASDGFTK